VTAVVETFVPPSSSHIASASFDPSTDTLTIEFADGRTYDYLNVPVQVYRDLTLAASVGSYFHRHVRNRYPAEEQ
jgi:hypothetical protein